MDHVVGAALAGLVAGFAIAMPLGSISLLLLRAGMTKGFRKGVPAALGVGIVDLTYCAAAVAVGTRVGPTIESWGRAPLVVSGLVVIGIGVYQLAKSGKRPVEGQGPGGADVSRWRTFWAFVALTAANPLTLLYFAALASVLASTTSGAPAAVAFVVGTGVASLGWQTTLVAIGGIVHKTVSPRASHVLSIVASLVVIGLGAAVLVKALT